MPKKDFLALFTKYKTQIDSHEFSYLDASFHGVPTIMFKVNKSTVATKVDNLTYTENHKISSFNQITRG